VYYAFSRQEHVIKNLAIQPEAPQLGALDF
jgi:hypothetical protein